jgi:peptide subunit release factor 1 (eRF1)
MVVSCYADTSVAEGFESHWRPHLKSEATRIRELLAGEPEALEEFERQLETIRRALESPEDRHARGMAVFGASGWDEALALSSDEPYEGRLVVDEEAYLVPLLVADYRRRAYLVVLTDTHRGRLYASVPGEAHLLDEFDEAVPKKNRSAGQRWGKQQATIARHREDHNLHYQKELVRRVERAWEARAYQGILLLGEREVLKNFRGLLPKRLADRVVHEAPHAWAGKQPEIRDRVREVVDAAIAGQQERLLEEIGRRLREGFAVATGPQEVIEALSDGQVLELVLGPDLGEVGSRCSGCRSLFAFEEATCPYCKAPCVKASLWQEILAQAARHGVAVHFVPTEKRGVVPGGVTALLVRDEPQWAPASSVAPETSGRAD